MSENLNEFQLIESFLKPLTNGQDVSQNLEDDVAVISITQNQQLITSKDMAVENVHFLLSDGGFKIASKILRSNLSDLASSGAKPLYYMLGFSKNSAIDQHFVEAFAKGLLSVQDEFDISLIGGDTVASKELFFSITVFGVIEKNKILSRLQAKNGNLIFVSGSIGDAYLGLNMNKIKANLSDTDKDYLRNRHFFPTPRLQLGQRLVQDNISQCAIDVSDGLLADLSHICQSCGLRADIDEEKIPLHPISKRILREDDSFDVMDLISAGDDYELIFTANQRDYDKIMSLSKELKLDLTMIGRLSKAVDEKPIISLFDSTGQQLNIKKYGYEH